MSSYWKRQIQKYENGAQKRPRPNPDVDLYQPSLVDVLASVQDYHLSRYLESPEVFSLACVAKDVLRNSEIRVTVDPYFNKLERGPSVPNPKTITLQEARSLRRAGAVIREIRLDCHRPQHWVGRPASWYTNFHFLVKEFCGDCVKLEVGAGCEFDKINFLATTTMPKLESLSLAKNRRLVQTPDNQRLQPLQACRQIVSLSLRECTSITNVEPLASLAKLETLDLSKCVRLEDISGLAGCCKLEVLNLRSCEKVSSIAVLSQLPALRVFWADGGLKPLRDGDFEPLANCGRLEDVSLGGTRITDLRVLAGCKNLRQLGLAGCREIDLTVLKHLPKLRTVQQKQSLK